MLNMLPTNDNKLLNSLSYKIFTKPFQGDIGYVFYNDEVAVGFARLIVGDTSCISAIGILEEHRGKGLGDFFTRSILFRCSQISRYIKINYIDNYFLRFGFEIKDNIMEIASENLVFTDKKHHC